jgi:hypothetical protein
VSAQPSVLQVVVMRDGLLVGTEVFVPGQYGIGSGPEADLRLDDSSVAAVHAYLHFKQARSAVQEAGGGAAVFVNGHRVSTCELRSMDEVSIGPFSLKVRVVTQRSSAPSSQSGPSLFPVAAPAETQAPSAAPKAVAPVVRGAGNPEPAAGAAKSPQSTVVSTRRSSSTSPLPESAFARIPAPPPAAPPPVTRTPPSLGTADDEALTQYVAMGGGPVATLVETSEPERLPAKVRPPPSTVPTRVMPKHRAPARERHFAVPVAPPGDEGQGAPRLFLELYWGGVRRHARSFQHFDKKKGLIAAEDEQAPMPLWGFGLQGQRFQFAEERGGVFRLYLPPGTSVEQRATDNNYYPVEAGQLEVGPGQRRCITLGAGHAVRLSGSDGMLLLAYVQAAIPRAPVNPLKGLPWLAMGILVNLLVGFGAFIHVFAKAPEQADFEAKHVNPVAVRLIAPPKKEEKKKIEEKLAKLKPKPKEKVSKVEKALPPSVSKETRKAMKSVEKLAAAGPALKDLLAAVDKMGSGPGAKNAKNDYKLNGLIGKAPIASAGIGSFGLGGGGAGGAGIKGLEMLRGKGGGGIGALGTGGVGRGSVAGTVGRATSRAVGAQGTIDKDAVAKVINSHIGEVSACYERALLKESGLAGKIQLEWQISTTGTVTSARTKSSTMKSSAVEQCILNSLKGWRFPPAKGAGVIITYPFMFNSSTF